LKQRSSPQRWRRQRHADDAAYEFGLFPLPVFDSYDDLPRMLRPDGYVRGTLRRAAADEAEFARLVAAEMPTTVVSPVFAASDFESTSMPEVRALYADRVQAERHAAGPPCALSAEELEGESSSPSARPESAIVDVRRSRAR
jgi:hypothetical protein